MNNISNIPISHYKVLSLPSRPEANSVYYLLDQNSNVVLGYITDKNGIAIPLFNVNQNTNAKVESVTGTGVTGTATNPKVDIVTFVSSQIGNLLHLSATDGRLAINPLTSPDGSIEIVPTSTELQIQLSVSIQSQINSALQPSDNISLLNNDVGYITASEVPMSYDDEKAQDAVGNILVDTSTIGFTYSDTTPSISANIKPNSITATELANNINVSEFINNGNGTSPYATQADVSAATIPDATITTKGKIQLAGDLGGSASSPTVPALANKADLVGGVIPINQIPPSALERLVIVANQAARFALTTATVQNGDTVKQTDTGVMYFVSDQTNLSNSSGYQVYTAGTASSVAWTGITGVPINVTNSEDAVNNKVSTIVGIETDTTKYPNAKALADYVTLKLPTSYSKIVYIDTVNPATATIFDLNNPPAVNDNSLKADINNLYIGSDASTWVYNSGTSTYVTKAAPTSISNFYLGGTTTDAGNNKSGAIERTGTVGGAPATASNHFVTKAQYDLKSNLAIVTNVQSGTTYTLVASDLGKQIVFTNAAAITVTIPTALPNGFNCEVKQQGTGQVTVTTSGTTLQYLDYELPTTYSQKSLIFIDNIPNLTETYQVYGQLTMI